MSTLSTQPAASSPTWSDVLDRVLHSLDAAIAATDERARPFQSDTPVASSPLVESPQWRERMRSIDHLLAAAEDAVARADGCCRAVEAELKVQAAQIERWQAVSRNSSRRLANVAPHSL
jgi:hypothetical protein